MRNLKKLLAVIVAICVLATMTIPAFAETDKTAAEIAETLGILIGDGEGVTDAYLAKGTTRMQAAIIYLRLFGLEQEAYAETSEENFADADEVVWAKGKAALAYLKNRPELGWIGDGTNFNPNGEATAQMIYKAILTALGYEEGEGKDFVYADTIEFAGEIGLDNIAEVAELSNEDLAEALIEALSVKVKDGSKTLLEKLIEDEVISEADAEEAGLVNEAVALDVSSAIALNSKVVEVSLGTAAVQKDLAGVTVADAAGKDVAVSKIEFAPWASDGKTVLVTLAADTTAGTYYTLTAGTKSVNFGGRGVDSDKPAVDTVISTDYNQVKITFNEPILISGTVAFAKSYSDKAALESTTIAYSGSNAIVISTEDQTASTLYTATIKGFTDLAGNTMNDSSDKTFVGTAKPTDNLKVQNAKSNFPEEAVVQFNLKVDAATIAPDNFKVEEAYGAKTALPVEAARIATTSDKDYVGSDLSPAGAAAAVIITVPGMKDNTLYKVTVSNMQSYVGTAMDSSKNNTTFVGNSKPTSVFSFNGVPSATSNTTITVSFARKLDKALAEVIENYVITEAYGSAPATITVSAAALQGNGTDVKLTVSSMKNTMYKLVVSNLKDIYGNAIDTSKNSTTFVGAAVEDKISGISSIERIGDVVIRVQFNHKVGASANDVAHYSVSDDVGYPSKAAAVTDTGVANYAYKVDLTIPKTTDGKIYTLTVKGLENADGVAMDAAGITGTFVGRGLASTLPNVVAAYATDKQTLKVYFDRDAADASIKGAGRVWNGNALVSGAIYAKYDGTNYVDLSTLTEYVWQDSVDKAAIFIRIDDDVAATTNLFEGTTSMDVKFANAKFVGDSDIILPTAKSTTALVRPQISGAYCEDQNNLVVIFNTPIAKPAATVALAYPTDDVSGSPAATSTGVTKIDDITYRFAFSTDLTPALAGADSQFYLKIIKTNITDVSAFFTMKGDNNDADAYGKLIFGASTTKKNYIDSGIYAMMPDDRTIEVYYPEPMKAIKYATDATSARDAGNYHLFKNDGTTGVGSVTINSVTYDATQNKAILHLSASFPTDESMYKIAIDNAVANENGTRAVKKSDGAAIDKIQFARSSTTHSAPGIKSVAIGADGQSIAVAFNRDVAFGAALNGTQEMNNAGAATVAIDQFGGNIGTATYSPITASDLDDYLTIKATFDGTSAEATIADADIASVVRNSNTQITINLNRKLASSTSGSVQTKTGAGKYFIDRTGTECKVTSGNESKATFGVPASFLYDTTAPIALANAYVSTSFECVNTTTATIVFSEKLDASKFVANSANGFSVSGGSAAITKAELGKDGVTVTLTGTNFAATTVTVNYTAGTLTDVNGVALASFATPVSLK